MPMGRWTTISLLLACLCACGQQPVNEMVVSGPPELLTGPAQRERLCARGAQDRVIDVFCRTDAPEITGVATLRRALGLDGETNVLDRGFAVTAHSTSLVHRSVSAINPRIVFLELEPNADDFTSVAYNRGDRFAEIVVSSRSGTHLEFYLVTYALPCDGQPEGCSPADELTVAAESGWTRFDIYNEADLVNTPKDCRVCHQPEGPGTTKILRMQELDGPWNHWFNSNSVGGRALLEDYNAAKGDEALAGVPGPSLRRSQPGTLRFAIGNLTPRQPFPFPSREIEAEVRASAAAQGGMQPADNSVPGQSPTWDALYERAKRGEVISVPYHDVKVTDPGKLAAMTAAYTDFREGTLAPSELPDIRDVYPDDPQELAEMGFRTEPGMNGEQILLQACAQCHNDTLDQTVSRARFNVDLTQVTAEVRRRAVQRINLPLDDPGVMPPALFRRLDAAAKDALARHLAP